MIRRPPRSTLFPYTTLFRSTPLLRARGQEVRVVARVLQSLAGELAELLGRDLLARRVDGREVRGRRGSVQVVGANGELVALELTAQAHVRPRLQLLREPDLVEPDRRDLAAAIRDSRLNDGEAPARAPHRGPQHLAGDGDLLLAR